MVYHVYTMIKSLPRSSVIFVATMLILAVLSALWAAPYVPGANRALTDDVRCLRDLRTFSIEVQIQNGPPEISPADAERLLIDRLTRRGFEIDMELTAPRLLLQIDVFGEQEDEIRDVMTFLVLHEHVKVYRLDEDLTLRVNTTATFAKCMADELDETLAKQIEAAVKIFADWVNYAKSKTRPTKRDKP